MKSPGRLKRENHPLALTAKVGLRRRVLDQVKPARVLDLFCGEQVLWRAVWQYAQEYVGCDDTPWTMAEDPRYACDNRRLLRCLDLQAFNVFDLDAFGSPWEQMTILAARRAWRPGEIGAVVVTDGSTLKTRWGEMPGAMRGLCGFSGTRIPATMVKSEELRRLALAGFARRAGVRPFKQWEAIGPSPAYVYYAAIVFKGIRPAEKIGHDTAEPA